MADPSSHSTKSALRGCLLLLLFSGCCVILVLDCMGYLDEEDSGPGLFSSTADLGTVLVPPGIPLNTAQRYDWEVDGLDPQRYHVQYGLGSSLIARIESDDEELGRRMHFRALSDTRFTFRAPPDCEVDMRCVYEELMRTHAEPVEELGQRFLIFTRAHQLSPAQAADLIIGFVQRIHYELPGRNVPFGVIPPALVPARNGGDCDSKALLAVMLLRQMGIDAVLLYSDKLEHAAVGVGLPGSGSLIRLNGRDWRYAEVTAEGWPIGMIPPPYDKPRLWTMVPLSPQDSG